MSIQRLTKEETEKFLSQFQRVSPFEQAKWNAAMAKVKADLETSFPEYLKKERLRNARTAELAKQICLC